jgi:hypothetical protein
VTQTSITPARRRRAHPHDTVRPAPLAPDPTDMPPLSLGKVLVLAERARLRQQLFHPGDARLEDVRAGKVLAGRLRRRRWPGEDRARRRRSDDPQYRAREAERKRAARQRKAAEDLAAVARVALGKNHGRLGHCHKLARLMATEGNC